MARSHRLSFTSIPLLLALGGCGTHAVVGVEGNAATGTCLGTCPEPTAAAALAAGWSEISDLALDTDGAMYLAGDFDGTLRLGALDLTAEPLAEGPVKNDASLIKLGGDGAAAWSWHVLDFGAFKLDAKPEGGVVVAGSFLNQLRLLPDDEPFGGSGPSDIIVAECRADGTYATAAVHSGNGGVSQVLAAANGDRILVGAIDGPTTIGLTDLAPAAGAQRGYFVIRLDGQGATRWARVFQGAVGDVALLSDDTLAVVGSREIGGSGVPLPVTGNAADAYLAVIDVAGATQWSTRIDPTPDDDADDAAAFAATVRESPSGQLVVAAQHATGSGPADQALHLQVYGRDGALLSHADVGAGAFQQHALAIAPDGDLLLWGTFSWPAQLGGQDLGAADAPFTLSAAFLTRFAPDATPRWTRTLEASSSTNVSAPWVQTAGMRVAPSGRIVVTGAYAGGLTIGTVPLPTTATDNQNAFYASFAP
jgi:hypothetical protein